MHHFPIADRLPRALPRPWRGFMALLLAVAFCLAGAPASLAQVVNYDLSTTSVMRIKLPVSQAVTVTISDAVGKVVAADPTIADAQPITDKSVYLVGKAAGTTTVNLFSAAGTPVGLLAVEVGAGGLGDAMVARRVEPPLEDVAVDDDGAGEGTLGGADVGGADVDQEGTGGQEGLDLCGAGPAGQRRPDGGEVVVHDRHVSCRRRGRRR